MLVFDNPPEATGDCYEAAFNYMFEEIVVRRGDPSMRLVHATVTGQGPLEGMAIGHAWVELGQGNVRVAIDRSQGHEIVLPVFAYRGMAHARNVSEYAWPDVRVAISVFKHYGPWAIEENPPLRKAGKGKAKLGEHDMRSVSTKVLEENVLTVGIGPMAAFMGFHPNLRVLYFAINPDSLRLFEDRLNGRRKGTVPIFQNIRAGMWGSGTIDAFWRHPLAKKLAGAVQYYHDEQRGAIVVTHLATKKPWQRRGLSARLVRYIQEQHPGLPIHGHELTDEGRAFMEGTGLGSEYMNPPYGDMLRDGSITPAEVRRRLADRQVELDDAIYFGYLPHQVVPIRAELEELQAAVLVSELAWGEAARERLEATEVYRDTFDPGPVYDRAAEELKALRNKLVVLTYDIRDAHRFGTPEEAARHQAEYDRTRAEIEGRKKNPGFRMHSSGFLGRLANEYRLLSEELDERLAAGLPGVDALEERVEELAAELESAAEDLETGEGDLRHGEVQPGLEEELAKLYAEYLAGAIRFAPYPGCAYTTREGGLADVVRHVANSRVRQHGGGFLPPEWEVRSVSDALAVAAARDAYHRVVGLRQRLGAEKAPWSMTPEQLEAWVRENKSNPPPSGRFRFAVDCLHSDRESIVALVEGATRISKRTFQRRLQAGQWAWISRRLGYDRDCSLSSDPRVGYFKSSYRGVPAVFFVWSGIEQIFTLGGMS